MTRIFTDLIRLSLRASGTLPSEAIQGEGIPRLDCFVVGLATEGSTPPPRNDTLTSYPLNLLNLDRHTRRAIRRNPRTFLFFSLKLLTGESLPLSTT
ncbi:MAG: hypothetical protein LBT00_02800 [Spirochaetaceae bacterium]|nr:hypothetical protein [Spirochaetaceae bacterium]